ncbi:MAG: hypothetical protein BWK78_03385 [Thiotrichaceae bacterium IS1]|nr:MAG: hypothetical protein BWK78_03385 [Thiotrichaceae bacterium IS1]
MKIILYRSNSIILSTNTYARLDNVRRLVGFCYLLSNNPENSTETQQRLSGLLESFAEKQAILLIPESLKEFFLDWLQKNNKINSLKGKDYEEKELEGEAKAHAVKNEILAYVETDDKTAVQIEFIESLSLAITSSKQPAWVNLLTNRLLSPCGEEIVLQAGTTLSERYQLVEQLAEEAGEGDLGVLWKATDLERFAASERDCEVVVKFLPQAFFKSRPDTLKTLAREFEQYKRIDHPHIAKTIEINCAGSQIYLVMGFLPGLPLSAVIKQHPNGISLPEAEVIIRGIGDALTHLHNKGVKRLDLKPVNIFYDFQHQSVKLVDFGISRAIKRFEWPPEKTPKDPYASWEVLGEDEPETSDDVYAFAGIVYELLSGQHPFERKTVAEAVQGGLSLKTLNQLEFYQNQAISDALAFRREDRIKTVDEFLVRFFSSQVEIDCPANLRRLYTFVTKLLAPLPTPLLIALIGLPFLIIWVVWAKPKSDIDNLVRLATEAWDKGSYQEAVDNAKKVVTKSSLAKEIVVAVNELEEARTLSKALDDARVALGQKNYEVAEEKVKVLLLRDYSNNNHEAKQLLEEISQARKIQSWLELARAKLVLRKWTIPPGDNAVEKATKVLEIEQDNSEAIKILTQVIEEYLKPKNSRSLGIALQTPILPGKTLRGYATPQQEQQIQQRLGGSPQ